MANQDRKSLEQVLVEAWYKDSWWLKLLIPFSWLFNGLARRRRARLQAQFQGKVFSAPLVVIGNISVGGSGKTPLMMALVKALADRGLRAGIVSRGYGGHSDHYPLEVKTNTRVECSGDEPLLMARKLAELNCPVFVDPDRASAVTQLLAEHPVDLVLADDGLQHYKMHRDIEIALIDGSRQLGNRRTLPAGPLREMPSRLAEVDFVLVNGVSVAPDEIKADGFVRLQPRAFRNLASNRTILADDWAEAVAVHAVAGLGNPQRFAATLQSLGLEVSLHPVDDHQALGLSDLSFGDDRPVIITAKDEVKLIAPVPDNLWVLDVEMTLDNQFVDRLISAINLNRTIKP